MTPYSEGSSCLRKKCPHLSWSARLDGANPGAILLFRYQNRPDRGSSTPLANLQCVAVDLRRDGDVRMAELLADLLERHAGLQGETGVGMTATVRRQHSDAVIQAQPPEPAFDGLRVGHSPAVGRDADARLPDRLTRPGCRQNRHQLVGKIHDARLPGLGWAD